MNPDDARAAKVHLLEALESIPARHLPDDDPDPQCLTCAQRYPCDAADLAMVVSALMAYALEKEGAP